LRESQGRGSTGRRRPADDKDVFFGLFLTFAALCGWVLLRIVGAMRESRLQEVRAQMEATAREQARAGAQRSEGADTARRAA